MRSISARPSAGMEAMATATTWFSATTGVGATASSGAYRVAMPSQSAWSVEGVWGAECGDGRLQLVGADHLVAQRPVQQPNDFRDPSESAVLVLQEHDVPGVGVASGRARVVQQQGD